MRAVTSLVAVWDWMAAVADAVVDPRPSDRPTDPIDRMWFDAYWPEAVPEVERGEGMTRRITSP